MKRKLLKKFAIIIGGFFFIIFAGIVLINLHIHLSTSDKVFSVAAEVPPQKSAVVLGTSKHVSRNRPNTYFVHRMRAAAELCKAGKIDKIILSGDNSEIYYNEPVDMRKSLMEMGVLSEDIILDFAGFRTFDSMVRAKVVFGQHAFIVVSQKQHVQRAVYIARQFGINAYGYIADEPGFSVRMQVREYLARVKAFLDIHVLRSKPKFLGPEIDIDNPTGS